MMMMMIIIIIINNIITFMVIHRRPILINVKSFPCSAFVFINTLSGSTRFQQDDKPKKWQRYINNRPASLNMF